jgi:hypothetical protein
MSITIVEERPDSADVVQLITELEIHLLALSHTQKTPVSILNRHFTLPDERKLGYDDHGASTGQPVFYLKKSSRP